MPSHSGDATEIARLSSALDRAAIRARVAVQRGEWGEAAAAATEAQKAKVDLASARAVRRAELGTPNRADLGSRNV